MKFFEHYIEFVAGGSGYDQTREDYFFKMEYPYDYKMYGTKIVKFDRDYQTEIEYNFYGMYPYQISNIPVKYENSEILKMNVNFHIDRYASGRLSSYDKYRGTFNNIQAKNARRKLMQDYNLGRGGVKASTDAKGRDSDNEDFGKP